MDIVGNFQRGLAFGQEQKERKRVETERTQLRNLAPQIMQGDPNAYTQAAAINPEAAGQFQSAGDQQYRRVTNVAKMMRDAINTNNPTAKQRAFQTIRPFLQQMTGGRPVPEQWDDSLLPGFEQFENRISMAQAIPKEIPSGFQQFQLTAQAAGLQPGSPEYQQAARIALGQEGRAASGGFGFFEFEGADGRKRMGRNNPRTGQRELYDETTGQFVPLGGAAGMGGVSAGAGPTETRVNIEGISPERQQQIANVASTMRAASVPEDRIAAWVSQELSTDQTVSRPGGPSVSAVPAGLAVGRAPEEQAALTTGAQEAAKAPYAIQEAQARSDIEIREAARKAEQEAAIKRRESLADADQKKAVDANTTLALLDEAESLIKRSTGSRAGALRDDVAATFGVSTEGAQAIAELNPVAARLTLAVPRMEGPQSDADRLLYQKAAGDFANPQVPRETRMAALQSMRRLAEKYKGVKPPASGSRPQRAVNPATGEVLVLRNGQWVPE
jgi:hypothetical protein